MKLIIDTDPGTDDAVAILIALAHFTNDEILGITTVAGNVKVDVEKDGDTLFKDTMSKDDVVNFIAGLGNIDGDKFQIKSDEDFDNVQIVFKKKFNQGGRASLSNGGLAKILGV